VIPALGLILAGGRGSRMGGADKGLIDWQGRPLVAHVLDALRPQVRALAINANRNLDRYAAFADRVLPDEHPFEGPLAGLHTALHHLPDELDWAWLVPCDAPRLPPGLALALWQARANAPAVLPCTPDDELHPTHVLAHRSLLAPLGALLASPGPRGAARWLQAQGATLLHWHEPLPGFNRPDDLAR
jgi:molybdenum cofactor guanylyltransferase